MNTVLLTGVAGFIANRTCEILLEQGFEVIGIDNLNDYYDVKLKEFRLDQLKKYPNFKFIKADIEDKSALQEIFKTHSFTTIYNLAARAGVRYSMQNPDIYVSTNIQGSLNLLEMAREYKVKKYILASTSSLYAGKEMPFIETLDVSEPISPYASTKKSAETMAYTYHHLYGIDVSIVRYFTVYGPMSRPDMAQLRFMKWIDGGEVIQLYGDGEQARDFTYVDDIAEGTILASKPLGFEIINLGGGQNPISINTMIAEYESLLGKKATIKNLPFNKADMLVTWANVDKAEKLLGWKPKVSFEDGIKNCVKHFKENKDLYNNIKL
ncbi:MAG: nucleoside-diphosphate-sugar epimerase [Bacteriovoracaceae bacterium]|jgi:UDP-glucuronate 4-epimerase